MFEEEIRLRIFEALKMIQESGCDFGRIELIVKGGDIKHVNVSFEILNTERSGENQL